MAQGNGGCLKGILIGCAGLVVLALGAGAFGYYKFVRPTQLRVQRVAAMEQESGQLRQRLQELNATYAYEPPEDPGEVVLTEEDVERYVAVRSAVADELDAFIRAGRGSGDDAESADAEPSGFRDMVGTMFRSFEETAETRLELQRASLEALEAQRMSPRELEALLNVVEWRFLGRSEASFFGLSEFQRELFLDYRRELATARKTLAFAERFNAEVNGQSAAELRAQVESLRGRLSGLEGEVEDQRDLHSRTRDVLQEHRAELEGLEAEGLEVLATLSEQEVEQPSVEGMETGG